MTAATSYYQSKTPYDMVEQSESERDSFDIYQIKFASKRPSHKSKILLVFGLLITLFLFLSYAEFTPHKPSRQPISSSSVDVVASRPGEIPNIVHFVRQLNRYPNRKSKPLSYEFRHFLAYYSAHYYLKPETINIWSDVTPEMIDEAKLDGDAVTKAVLAIPNFTFHYVTMPNKTEVGTPIYAYAHKSDFIRTRVMAEHGGQYFDDDSWVIKDLAPFRLAGFENIFGIEWGGDICQAMWMATPGNTLMKVFERLQETVFDGGWLTASNILVTNLVKDIRGYGNDRHALLLEQNAFFPGQWNIEDDGLPMYYKLHQEAEDSKDVPPLVASVDDIVKKYPADRRLGWLRDWRNTYVIHGFSNAIRDNKAEWMFKPYTGFTPQYVLSRESNIGRALYPALRDAIDQGYLQVDLPLSIAIADSFVLSSLLCQLIYYTSHKIVSWAR